MNGEKWKQALIEEILQLKFSLKNRFLKSSHKSGCTDFDSKTANGTRIETAFYGILIRIKVRGVKR